jgi:hypothetical protein
LVGSRYALKEVIRDDSMIRYLIVDHYKEERKKKTDREVACFRLLATASGLRGPGLGLMAHV